jgi:hypothetical protein
MLRGPVDPARLPAGVSEAHALLLPDDDVPEFKNFAALVGLHDPPSWSLAA